MTDNAESRRFRPVLALLGLVLGAILLASCGGGDTPDVTAGAAAGADNADEAVEIMVNALIAEDFVTLAAIMDPYEQAAMTDYGFALVDELVRLDVLAEDIDLASLQGIDIETEGLEPTVTLVGNGLAHAYFGAGSSTITATAGELPLGPVILETADEGDLDDVETETETYDGNQEMPLVIVQRDGSWYVSLMYTIAEAARLEAGMDLPDPADRLESLGADSPEAAVEQLIDSILGLDASGVIGMHDPETFSALYDYAPLFIDDLDMGANEILGLASLFGAEWELVDLELSSEELGDDLAVVTIDAARVQVTVAPEGLIDIAFDADSFSASVTNLDDFTPDLLFEVTVDENGCIVGTIDEGFGPETESICPDDDPEFDELRETFESFQQAGLATTQVDGMWFVDPIRTGGEAMLSFLEPLDADDVRELIAAAEAADASGLPLDAEDIVDELVNP